MNLPAVLTTYFALKGGLNLVTPPLSTPDGMCRDSLNFEIDIDGGYRRVAGYERFDGHASPSDALFYSIACNFVGTVSANDVIVGATSGATGVVLTRTDGNIIFTKLTGAFLSGENITVLAVVVATSTSIAISGLASTPLQQAEYTKLATDVYRQDISAVPGSGGILGVHRLEQEI